MTFAFIVDSVEFTPAVIAGETSLGGSESACLGLARALVTRGHRVHIFTTKITPEAVGIDHAGVAWNPISDFAPMNEFVEWDVVISLRAWSFFGMAPIQARMRILWNQDLLVPGSMQAGVMSIAWALDQIAYVSQYHQQQWEDLQPELKGIGWASRNGIDLAQVPSGVVKDPNRIIHISRPERGLRPLLALWPKLKAKVPDATLQICRYSSMYDDTGWGQVCRAFDEEVARVNAEVGGITYLGELNKPQLYQAISEAAVMWYPGVASFAETNCIAATEANACGTPFVGSYKGALVETAKPSKDANLLIRGDADRDEAYARQSVDAVASMLDGCRRQAFFYRALQHAGRKHAESYDYATLAAEWEAHIEDYFNERYASNEMGILRQLLHEDDHVAAQLAAQDLIQAGSDADQPEAVKASDFCDYVIAGKDHTDEQYAAAALDPIKEAEGSGRFRAVTPHFANAKRVLDVACGNGSFAIALALANPTVHVHGLDFAQGNIDVARAAALKLDLSDRLTFERCTVYDFDAQTMHADWHDFVLRGLGFEGLFVGEFVEHVGNCTVLIDELEKVLINAAKVVYTCPAGACVELMGHKTPLHRGHVHRFHMDDIQAVWGQKANCSADYLASGWTGRGTPFGNWLITYDKVQGLRAGERPLAERIRKTRPMPKLSVGMIAKDAELDLARCLTSVWPIADEIVIGVDRTTKDSTREIAVSFHARILELDPVTEQRDGFAGARNQVLNACTGDWFMWIDADEQLVGAMQLRRYLDGPVFRGFVLHQNHLQLDAPQHHDIPVRVFRKDPSIQFYGCVHEQPQDGDPNTDIHPTLDALDVQLVHTGYLTENVRRDKQLTRNTPLLIRDAEVFPTRLLGKVLILRETVLQANRAREAGNSLKAHRGYLFALKVFRDHFSDPGHKYHGLARPWYQAALQALGLGWEVELALAGRKGGMQNRGASPQRLWVGDADELAQLVKHELDKIAKGMEPATFHVDPFEDAIVAEAPQEAVTA